MTRKPLTSNAGKIEQLPDGAGLNAGGWNLPAAGGTVLYVMVADASGHAVWTQLDHGTHLAGSLGDDDHTLYSLVDGTRPFSGVVGGVIPTDHAHLATKEYVDSAIQVIQPLFLLDAAHASIASCKNTQVFDSGLAQADVTTASVVDDQALQAWADATAESIARDVPTGVFALHIHAEKTSGQENLQLYFKIFEVDSGFSETLIMTSETSDEITSEDHVVIHATLGSPYAISVGSWILIRVYATVTGSGNAPTAVLYYQGATSARFDLPTLAVTIDHGHLLGLSDDDHTAYHTDARGDARYYTESELDAGQLDNRYFTEAEHLDSSAGAGDSGKPIKLDAGGLIDDTMLDVDHGTLSGLADDDHALYMKKTGWETDVLGDVTLTVTDGTRTVAITPTGDDVSYWIDGTQYTFSSVQSVVFDDTEGNWYIYFVGSTLTKSQTAPAYDDTKAYVATLYWDAVNNESLCFSPNLHSWGMPELTHKYLHEVFNARWDWGLAVDDGGSDDINVTAGEIQDEDIDVSITDGLGSGWWDQTLTPLSARILYRSGASGLWRQFSSSTTPVHLISNVPQINVYSGGSWGWRDVAADEFFVYWVVTSSTKDGPVYLIPGQEDDVDAATARSVNHLGDMNFGDSPSAERKVISRVMFQRLVGGVFYAVEELADYRDVDNDPSGAAPTISDHGSLTGLNDNDHVQYVLHTGATSPVDLGSENVTTTGTIVGANIPSPTVAYQVLISSAAGVAAWSTAGGAEILASTGGVATWETKPFGFFIGDPGGTGRILISTGTASASWGTDLVSLTRLVVDNIAIDGAIISSDTGAISFGNENVSTSGTVVGSNIPSPTVDDQVLISTASGSASWSTATADQFLASDGAGVVAWTDKVKGDATLWISPTGNDTTGDGSEGDPYKTVSKCRDVFLLMSFSPEDTATVMVEDGVHTVGFTEIKSMTPKLEIEARSARSFTFSEVTSQSLVSGIIYDIQIKLDTTTNIFADDYVVITACSATSFVSLNGCWKVISIDDATHITIRIKHGETVPSTGAVSPSNTIRVPRAHMTRTGGQAFRFHGKVIIKGIVFLGTTGIAIQGFPGAFIETRDYVGASGWSYGIYAFASDVDTRNSAFSNCTHGNYYVNVASCIAINVAFSGCTTTGLNIDRLSHAYITTCRFASNAYGVNTKYGSSLKLISSTFSNNTLVAVSAIFGSLNGITGVSPFTDNASDYSPALDTQGNDNSWNTE